MTRLSIDLKLMPKCHKGYTFILVVTDVITSFVVAIPIPQSWSVEIGDALIEHVFSKYSTPEWTIMDQDNAFMPTLIIYFFKKFCHS